MPQRLPFNVRLTYLIPQSSRLYWQVALSEVQNYKNEVQRGLVHTPARRAEMRPLVEELDVLLIKIGELYLAHIG